MTERVAVVGLGAMGGRTAARALAAGHEVHGYDPSPAAAERAAAGGVTTAATAAAAVADAGIVVLSLPMPADVLVTAEAIAGEVRAGAVVVDISTIDPGTARDAAAAVAAGPGTYVESPVLGRPEKCGEWTLVQGGPAAACERVRPFLEETIAGKTVHLGGVGAGSTVKLLNNLMFGAINAVTAEAFNLARVSGVDPARFAEVVAGSGAATVSPLFHHLASRIPAGDYAPNFGLGLLAKDNRLALQLARSAHAPAFLAVAVEQVNALAEAQGWSAEDTSAVHRLYELLSPEADR